MATAAEIPQELIAKLQDHRAQCAGDGRPRYPRWAREALLKLYESGMKATVIAAATGVPADQIYVWTRKHRAERKILMRSKFTELKIAKSDAPRAPELSVRICGVEIQGFTPQTLGEFLRDAGWRLR